MNLDLKTIPAKLTPALTFVKKYAGFVCFVAVLSVFVFLFFRINQYTNSEPSEDAINEKLQEVKRPRIDANAVQKIEELEERNIEVKALFDTARENPFQD